jgi:hypothetical protein
MPETTMNKYNGAAARENNIGAARQIFVVQTKPQAGPVQ